MILSTEEIKRNLLANDFEKQNVPFDLKDKKASYVEIGQLYKRMTGTSGWKVLETWILSQLDINLIIRGNDRDRIRAEAYADLLTHVNNSIKWGELAQDNTAPK